MFTAPPAHGLPKLLLLPVSIAASSQPPQPGLGPSGERCAPPGQEQQPRQSRAEVHLYGKVQMKALHHVPHASTELLLTTAGGLQPHSVQDTKGVNPHIFPSPPHSPQPHLHRDGHTILQPHFHCPGAADAKATPLDTPGKMGASGAAPAPSMGLLPPQGWAGGRDRSGREEGVPAVAQASRELNMNSRAV